MTFKPMLIQQVICSMLLAAGAVGVMLSDRAIARPLSDHATAISQSLQIAQAPTLQGSWRLANMTEPPFPTPMVPSGDLTADFEKGRIFGSGGCNRYNGSYTTKGNQMKIGPLASTFKACEQPVMEQETRFLKALQQAVRYTVNKDGLQIYYKNDQGEGVLRFTSQTVQGLW
jgi:heat shock protein HslJ